MEEIALAAVALVDNEVILATIEDAMVGLMTPDKASISATIDERT